MDDKQGQGTPTPAGGSPGAPAGDETPPTQGSGAGEESRKFDQKDVDKIAGNRAKEAAAARDRKILEELGVESLNDAKERLQAWQAVEEETQTEADKAKAEAEKLRKQAEELEPYKEQAEQYRALIEEQVKAQIEAVPQPIRELAELDEKDPVQQLAWLNKNREKLTSAIEIPGSGSRDESPRENPTVSHLKTRRQQVAERFNK